MRKTPPPAIPCAAPPKSPVQVTATIGLSCRFRQRWRTRRAVGAVTGERHAAVLVASAQLCTHSDRSGRCVAAGRCRRCSARLAEGAPFWTGTTYSCAIQLGDAGYPLPFPTRAMRRRRSQRRRIGSSAARIVAHHDCTCVWPAQPTFVARAARRRSFAPMRICATSPIRRGESTYRVPLQPIDLAPRGVPDSPTRSLPGAGRPGLAGSCSAGGPCGSSAPRCWRLPRLGRRRVCIATGWVLRDELPASRTMASAADDRSNSSYALAICAGAFLAQQVCDETMPSRSGSAGASLTTPALAIQRLLSSP